jgi:hypothetical protein
VNKLKFFLVHTMKAKRRSTDIAAHIPNLASAGYEQSKSCPGRCTARKESWYPLGVPHSWSGLIAEVKYALHLLEFKPQTIELTDN